LRDLKRVFDPAAAVLEDGDADPPEGLSEKAPELELTDPDEVLLEAVVNPVVVERPAGLLRPG